jgi:hypothetical protein
MYYKEGMTFIISAVFIVIVVISAGYLLDAIGAYRFPRMKEYRKDKTELLKKIKEIKEIKETFDDPDRYLSIIWYNKPDFYKSIFDERSEWVMILISSFVLLVSAIEYLIILCVIYSLFKCRIECWMLPITLITSCLMFVMGYHLAAKTGIKRMKAHDEKILYCLEQIFIESNNKIK